MNLRCSNWKIFIDSFDKGLFIGPPMDPVCTVTTKNSIGGNLKAKVNHELLKLNDEEWIIVKLLSNAPKLYRLLETCASVLEDTDTELSEEITEVLDGIKENG